VRQVFSRGPLSTRFPYSQDGLGYFFSVGSPPLTPDHVDPFRLERMSFNTAMSTSLVKAFFGPQTAFCLSRRFRFLGAPRCTLTSRDQRSGLIGYRVACGTTLQAPLDLEVMAVFFLPIGLECLF